MRGSRWVVVLLLAGCGGSHRASRSPADMAPRREAASAPEVPGAAVAGNQLPLDRLPEVAEPLPSPAAVPGTPLADGHRAAATRLLEVGLPERFAFERLSWLTDRIGNRLAGSAALTQAVTWAQATLREDGQDNVRAEKVMVPHWVRGAESAELVAPVARPLHMLGLGGSVGTPKKGLEAELLVVSSFDELTAAGPRVKGKIVLYDVVMPPYGAHGSGYGKVIGYRSRGADRASALGAVAVLVRSLTARSLRTPHTGMMRYDDKQPRIPAAAVSTEDAALLHRLAGAGPVRVRLKMAARTLPDAESANVLGELTGREKPEEIVLIGAHLDSWDVGQGAHDDGAGVTTVIEALRLLRVTGLRPRRTVRVVLFTNEENGLRGAKAYAAAHGADKHVVAIEADGGGFAPWGVGGLMSAQALAQLGDVVTLLEPLRAANVVANGDGGADIEELTGIPLLSLAPEGSTYFDYHHTEADTLDKVNPEHLQMNAVAMAILAYTLAEMEPALAGGKPLEEP